LAATEKQPQAETVETAHPSPATPSVGNLHGSPWLPMAPHQLGQLRPICVWGLGVYVFWPPFPPLSGGCSSGLAILLSGSISINTIRTFPFHPEKGQGKSLQAPHSTSLPWLPCLPYHGSACLPLTVFLFLVVRTLHLVLDLTSVR